MKSLHDLGRTALALWVTAVLVSPAGMAADAASPVAEKAATPATVTTTVTPHDRDAALRPDPAIMAADALVVRPVGLAATAVGAAIFVVALPFAAITKDVKGVAAALVGQPANFTFKRKLGDFDSP